MIKYLVLILSFCCMNLHAQKFELTISDNNGLMHQLNTARFTQDSLIITAKSDYGRSNITYLNRLLSPAEKIEILRIIKSFPADSLKSAYLNEYNNFEFIDAEHFPRVIDVQIVKKSKNYISKATNCYVHLYKRLIDSLNPMLPQEVRIKYEANKFNAFY
jgi:hypothetical protein